MHKLVAGFLGIMLAVAVAGCSSGSSSPSKPNIANQAAQATQSRAEAFAQASSLYPSPVMRNFPLRKALVELTARQDEINHPWYIYVQAQMTGQVIGYYVAKTAPQSECNTVSSTQSAQAYDNGQGGSNPLILDAPTLNGVYAGGAGATGSCDIYFFEDATTNAMIELKGDSFFVTDQPLALNVPAFRVKTSH